MTPMLGIMASGISGNLAVSVEYLVVAGGGGGGSNHGGGAGAGGFRTASGLLCALATNFTVTVGAGGTAAPGTQGNSSVFSTITSVGGGRLFLIGCQHVPSCPGQAATGHQPCVMVQNGLIGLGAKGRQHRLFPPAGIG